MKRKHTYEVATVTWPDGERQYMVTNEEGTPSHVLSDGTPHYWTRIDLAQSSANQLNNEARRSA